MKNELKRKKKYKKTKNETKLEILKATKIMKYFRFFHKIEIKIGKKILNLAFTQHQKI